MNECLSFSGDLALLFFYSRYLVKAAGGSVIARRVIIHLDTLLPDSNEVCINSFPALSHQKLQQLLGGTGEV